MSVYPDNRLDDAPMVSVTCLRCGADVEARKSTWSQTSVQWTDASVRRCEERCQADILAAHAERGVFLACSALTDSIADAVRVGTLHIVDGTA